MFGKKHHQKEEEKREHAQAEIRAAIVNLIALAQGQDSTDPDWPLVLRPGERLFSTLTGGGLFEPRREAGHYSGRSAGVSVPTGVAGIRVRLGKSAGTFVQGAETPTVIDTGNASITSQRVVFQGGKYTREWEYSKLIGIIHYSDHPATAIQVSNRQKTSAIVYAGVASTEPIRLALTVAVAVFHGEADRTIKELQDELAQLDATRPPPPIQPAQTQAATTRPDPQPDQVETPQPASEPTPPPPSTAASSPPCWAADPSGRHQWRYWDGRTWTDYVADNGQESRDSAGSSQS